MLNIEPPIYACDETDLHANCLESRCISRAFFCEHNTHAIEHSKMANSYCKGHSKTFKEFLQGCLFAYIRSLQIILSKFKVAF